MIRVFARKTKWCPTDELAFFGKPPLGKLPKLPVFVSCTFTWDIQWSFELYEAWALHWRRSNCRVRLGGPAFNDPGDKFCSGKFLKTGVTITSRGCPKKCPWCLVPMREGSLRELVAVKPGNIISDNNLLACSAEHIKRVFTMLRDQKAVEFTGGLDIDYLKSWHIDLLKKIKLKSMYVACDCDKDIKRLDKAVDLLGDFSCEKKRCYVLVGANGETVEQAERRCRVVFAKGFLPYAQLYRGLNSGPSRGDWHDFCHYWCQPKLYRKKESGRNESDL